MADANKEKISRPSSLQDMFKEIYTVSEVAYLMRCSPKVIYEALANGTLDGYKVGRGWRIPGDSVREFVTRHKKEVE